MELAEVIATFTLHVGEPIVLVLDAVVAASVGTPPHVLVIVCEGLARPFHIGQQVLSF